jgi:peroxiredoxin
MIQLGGTAPDCELIDDERRTRRLSKFWSNGPAAIVFVRHLGCAFCRREAALLRNDAPQFESAGAEIAFVTMAPTDDAAEFRKHYQLPFSVLADPEQKAYREFQVPRGNWISVMGPQTWSAGLKALIEHGAGRPVGDVRQLSGGFVVARDGTIRYVHLSQHSADLPPHAAMLDVVRNLRNEEQHPQAEPRVVRPEV